MGHNNHSQRKTDLNLQSKQSIKGGLFWSFAERILAQATTAIVTIILARILEPEYYGIISLVLVFIAFCNVFVTSGMGTALVQKKEICETDYNTAFFISITIAVLLYCVVFVASPYIAAFYHMAQLEAVLKVMGLRLPIASLNTVQQARVQRHMAFKRFFISTLFGTVISGIIGIAMALSGFGVWALVAQYLSNTVISTIVLFFVEKWFPKIQFSLDSGRKIFNFGWKVLATELTFTLETDVRSLIIGKVFGSADLAFFEEGRKFPGLIVQNINASINKVMLPAYSKKQDCITELKELLRRSIRAGLFFMAPLLIGFAAIADTFFPLVLTEKWNGSIPFVRIFCLAYLTRPLESFCHQALLGVGRSGVVLKIMIVIHSIDLFVVLLAAFVFKSVLGIALATVMATVTSLLLFLNFSRSVLGYSLSEQLKDLIPVLFVVSIMAICVWLVGFCFDSLLLKAVFQIAAGAVVYVSCAALFRLEAYGDMKNQIRSFLKTMH